MILNPQYIVISFMLTNFDPSIHAYSDRYVPHTTTSMTQSLDDEFYDSFWNSLIKEDYETKDQ